MADDPAREVATRDGRRLTYLEVGDPERAAGHPQPRRPEQPTRGAPARSLRDEEPDPADLRRPARHGSVQRAECPHVLGLGRRPDRDRRRVGIRRIRRDRLVGRRTMGTRRGRLHRSCSTAPRQQHRAAEVTERSATTPQRNTCPRSTRWAELWRCKFTPGFRLMYASLGFTAKRFPASFVKQVRKGRQRLRPTDPVSTGDRGRLRRLLRRMLRPRLRRTRPRR